MPTSQGARLSKIRRPQLQPQPLQTTERRSRLLTRDRRQTASTESNSNQRQESELLQAIFEEAASTESSLKEEIQALKTSLARTTANETSLKQENDEHQKQLARTASTERALRREIETLKESLTRVQQESENQRSLLVQAGSAELSLRREMGVLEKSHAQTASKLREEIEVLKTTLTHALTSERDMRTSARETRERWEKVEKSLRGEIDTLRVGPRRIHNDVKGKMVASGVRKTIQHRLRTVENTTTLKQPRKPLEGSSDIHILLDDLALQSLTKDAPDPTEHSTSDAFGNRLLPEFTALERATEGLQLAVNSEVRAAYSRKWSTPSPGSLPQSSTSVARNLRLLVVLWEASGVKELLGSLPSILEDTTPAMESEDCAICTDEISPKHRVVVEGCGHAMCKDCLREYIGARLGEKVWPVWCPICMATGGRKGRTQAITRVLVDELVLPTTVLSQWTDFELSQFIIPVTCPKCEKPNLFELAEYNRSTILICNHGCECAWCRDCSHKVNIEAPHSCGDDALEELAGERRWMRCPRPSCRVMVEKNVGCNHITCRCGMHFCYQCGEDITGRIFQHASTCQQQS